MMPPSAAGKGARGDQGWSWGLPPTEPTRLSEREGNVYVDAHSGVVYRDGFGWGSVR